MVIIGREAFDSQQRVQRLVAPQHGCMREAPGTHQHRHQERQKSVGWIDLVGDFRCTGI